MAGSSGSGNSTASAMIGMGLTREATPRRAHDPNPDHHAATGNGARKAAPGIGAAPRAVDMADHGVPAHLAEATGELPPAPLLDCQARAVAGLPLRQFLRLRIAASGLSMSESEIIRRALDAYLDRCAIDDLSDCATLSEAAARCEALTGTAIRVKGE